MMTEHTYTSMRVIQREIDSLLLTGMTSILVLCVCESLIFYVLRTFRRVSPNTCQTANSESVKP